MKSQVRLVDSVTGEVILAKGQQIEGCHLDRIAKIGLDLLKYEYDPMAKALIECILLLDAMCNVA